ncbi:unnamed protein product [Clonostachys rosea f. rosea IK726]|uniref:Uncharacterized protein n=1 Tax=Clonostachys rosea f. rosea IK726 TaxID=1349383 RepID=A0ACA9ULV4_BIOOC|nr:unnamed protein product [Clonostachys rosea f. rosea IK726]
MANANALLSWAQSFTPAPEKGKDVYRATETPWHPIWGRGVFGGVLLGQSLAIAQDTVPSNFVAHSLHGSFILSAKTTVPTFYRVERLRDGKSVASRVVKAFQSGECVFIATISFFVESPSTKRGMNHQVSMPTEILERGPPSGPDQDVDPALLAEAGQTRNGSMYECVRIPPVRSEDQPERQRLRQWIRARGPAANEQNSSKSLNTPTFNQRAHLAALAYMTDNYFIGTVARAHGGKRFNNHQSIQPIVSSLLDVKTEIRDVVGSFDELAREEAEEYTRDSTKTDADRANIQLMLTLDHSIYFHNQASIRADDWMLAEMETPWAGDERGLVVQRVWNRDGTLVASCFQEGMIRLSRDKPQNKL